ncbi:MAG: hypothetical protein EOM02_02410 [Synergistales bacterium]|nr:hypothetical protein [Synergistales bacterium]
MGVPNFAKIGDAPVPKSLIIGALEAAVRQIGAIKNATGAAVPYVRGAIALRADDGFVVALTDATMDATIAAFPGAVLAVLDEDVSIPANGEGTVQMIVKGELAADLLSLDGVAWGSLAAADREKLRNLLTGSGIIPVAVKR